MVKCSLCQEEKNKENIQRILKQNICKDCEDEAIIVSGNTIEHVFRKFDAAKNKVRMMNANFEEGLAFWQDHISHIRASHFDGQD